MPGPVEDLEALLEGLDTPESFKDIDRGTGEAVDWHDERGEIIVWCDARATHVSVMLRGPLGERREAARALIAKALAALGAT